MTCKKLLLLLVLISISLGTVFGAQSDYWIENYSLEVNVGRNAINTISEDITMNYMTPHHGFYRDIPYYYESQEGPSRRIKITSISSSDPYSKDTDNGYLSLKIGDSEKTYRGLKDYSLSYLYDIGADTNKDYDEFYFNLIGSYWECPIEHFSFKVTIPCTENELDYVFLTRGYYRSTTQVPFEVSAVQGVVMISGTLDGFAPGEALTLSVQLPDNWYVDARKPFDARQSWEILGYVVMASCVLLCVFFWALFGKDTVPIITAKFEAPEGFSPLVEGYLSDGTVDDKDITSMIYYWADKGYLTISEQKKNKFVFTKTGDVPLTTPDFERKLFYAFFAKGNVVTMDTLKMSNFYESMAVCKREVERFFTKTRKLKDSKANVMSAVSFFISLVPVIVGSFRFYLYEGALDAIGIFVFISIVFSSIMAISFKALFAKWYIRKSNFFATVRSLIPVAVFILLVPSVSASKWQHFLISILAALLCVFLAVITEKRSVYGTKVLEGTLGYREFIEKVQISELVTMIDKDPMLYYHVLCYAIVFGLEDKWAKKFASVAVPPPVWFTGPTVFDYMYFTRMTSRMNSVVRTTVMKPTNVKLGPGSLLGGSSFGSGGFAGGGFGGGGGRAW